jgi:hypothetical protein
LVFLNPALNFQYSSIIWDIWIYYFISSFILLLLTFFSYTDFGHYTNKSDMKEPRHPASAEQVLCPDPIGSTTAKPTTPLVPLINQLRASHTTLMVVLFSQVDIQWIGPYGEVLGKQPEPPKVSLVHHHNQDSIIVS